MFARSTSPVAVRLDAVLLPGRIPALCAIRGGACPCWGPGIPSASAMLVGEGSKDFTKEGCTCFHVGVVRSEDSLITLKDFNIFIPFAAALSEGVARGGAVGLSTEPVW